MISLFLLRLPQKDFNKNIFDQTIAIIAFCSGIFLMGTTPTGGNTSVLISNIVVFVANFIGLFTLLNLGKSFGIFIAYRKIKCDGLYSIVRHPMYFKDILLRIGYVISHISLYSITIVILSIGCYIYRAILEERFLSKQPEYREYMQRVKYRFIPYIF
jgi:protein-S-isoprenylcysteine O-methyltransferase Ste14